MSRVPIVAVTDFLSEADPERAVLDEVAEVRLLQAVAEAEVAEKAADADVLLTFHAAQLGDRVIEKLERCRGIIRVGVGFDNVNIQAAGARGIVVCNVPDYGTEEVADHALLLLLAAARRLTIAHESIRRGVWDTSLTYGSPRMRGKTLGLIGCGRIGSAMARRGLALGMRVVFYDPYKPDGHDKALGIERAERLEDLLPQAHFVSIHTPLTGETHNILNADTLALLRAEGAYVINTARGPCVDLDALHDALESGRVIAAGLDVVEPEPLVDERIRLHPRVVLTPHSAFYSLEGFHEMRTKAALEAKRMILGEPVRNVVNRRFLDKPRCELAPLAPIDA